MPVHDWTRVDAGIFHDFHLSWIAEIKRALNQGLLPRDYYALAEQITGNMVPDVLTLCRPVLGSPKAGKGDLEGGIAVADAPPKATFHARMQLDPYAKKAKGIVVRHRSGHRIIAMIEIISPGNKGSQTDLAAFTDKAEQAIRAGIHLLIVDLFPPNPRAAGGIHHAIWGEDREGDFSLPEDKPLCCVSYVGYPNIEVFVEPRAVGEKLPAMPLFLTPEVYVQVPLEETYRNAWEAVPEVWQEELVKVSGNGVRKKRRGR